MTIKAEYIWIDGTEPTPAAALQDQGPRRSADRPAHLGIRRLEHQPGARQGVRLRAEAGLLLPGPDPGRRPTCWCCARCCSPT